MVKKQRGFSKGGTFLVGFLVGMLVSVLIVVGLAGYFIRHPQKIIEKAVDVGMSRVVEQAVQSIPKDYMARRQKDISESVRQLTQAFSEDRISSADIQKLSKKVLTAVADRKVTPEEIDELIGLIDQFTRRR